MKIEQTKLKNGINLLTVKITDTKLISSNVIVKTGGRNEDKNNCGISHFLEHMAFKGTNSYPVPGESTEIIEKLGGIVNAWTDEQSTCYWNILPTEHADISLKVLSEQVSSLVLPEQEIEKEKGPIIEEIRRSHDDPYSFVMHNIYSSMWPNQPIGGGVLGPEENIKKFKKDDFLAYLKSQYVGSNINVCVVSSLEHREIFKVVERYFGTVRAGDPAKMLPIVNNQESTQIELKYRKIKQAHIVWGYKAVGYNDESLPALLVLMNILGSGMSSVLFKEIREKRGAAYAIQGFIDTFEDAGAAVIYAGLNLDKTEEVMILVKKIIEETKTKPFSEKRVNDAKEFIKGITLYRLDGVERVAGWITAKGLHDKKFLNPDIFLEEINKVTARDIMEVANQVFNSNNETVLILGPFKDKEKFAKILTQKQGE